MELKDWVKAARLHAELTQEQLADALSMTKGNISGWEHGRHQPSYDQVRRISARTGYPVPGITGTDPEGTNDMIDAPQFNLRGGSGKTHLLAQDDFQVIQVLMRDADVEVRALAGDMLARFLSDPVRWKSIPKALLALLESHAEEEEDDGGPDDDPSGPAGQMPGGDWGAGGYITAVDPNRNLRPRPRLKFKK